MLLIIAGILVGLFLIASVCPIWCIKWKIVDLDKAILGTSKDYFHVPKGWLVCDKGLPLWTLLYGKVDGLKTAQSYTYIYSIGNNIKYKIGLFG
jgi:hypothetical protein